MIKINKRQTEILTAALQSPDGSIDQPEGSARDVGNLIKQGLMLRIGSGKGPSQLSITDAGRAAINPTVPPAGEETKPESEPPAPKARSGPGGKLGLLVELLRRPEGAGVAEMSAATGWLPHSVRGAIAGGLKTKHKLTVVSEKTERGRIYRIPAEEAC